MKPSTLLITGFEPFGGEQINPAWEVAQALHGQVLGGARVQSVQLPCVFGASRQALAAALRQHRPVAVLSLGLAGNRSAVSFERVAINWVDARIADNAGAQPVDQPVVAGGPSAYFTRLPIKAMLARLRDQGLPAELSFSAGSFVCNEVFYGLMHALRRRQQVPAGFIHLPPLPQQASRYPGVTCLGLDDQVQAVQLAAEVALAGGPDLQFADGRVA
jgi:pyroglutamyl-peptidase